MSPERERVEANYEAFCRLLDQIKAGIVAREQVERLRKALRQLLDEVIAAGFETARDYNWPRAIADAKAALAETNQTPPAVGTPER